MKKLTAIIMAVTVVLTMTFALSACKKDEQADDPSVKVVTDAAGKAVTDKDGNEVTELVTKSDDVPDDNDDTDPEKPSRSGTADGNSDAAGSKNPSKTNEKTSGAVKPTSSDKTDAEKPTGKPTEKSTEKATTTKPRNRKVSVTINIPYYDNEKHNMTVWYKVLGKDKEYTALEPQEITFNNSSVDVDLGKHKGDVRVVVKIDGMKDISNNKVTIKSNETHGEISIVTGIEKIEAEM